MEVKMVFMIRKYIIASIFVIFISFCFIGCSPKEANIEENGEQIEDLNDSFLYDKIETDEDRYIKQVSLNSLNNEISNIEIPEEIKEMLSKSFEKNRHLCGGILPNKGLFRTF